MQDVSLFNSTYNFLQRVPLSTPFIVGTLSTVEKTINTVCSGYNFLHCVQLVQLSTLSTVGTTIYTVNIRYNYLHCVQ